MKVLVDTPVWIDHFHSANPRLQEALRAGHVWTHTVVIGELASGRLARRDETITLLRKLPAGDEIDLDEGLHLIAEHDLAGRGLSWSDVQLLAAARIDHCLIWTHDRTLAKASQQLQITHPG